MDLNSLQQLPEMPERVSKLTPHTETILTLRKKRYTYRQIARFLAEHYALKVNQSTVFDFVTRTRKLAKSVDVSQSAQPPAPIYSEQSAAELPTAASLNDPFAEARERMRRHKEAPTAPKPKRLFDIPEEASIEPLVLLPKTKKEK